MGEISENGWGLVMCFGSRKPKVDHSALNWQKEQAAKARREENARKARIDEGLMKIKEIFEGRAAVPASEKWVDLKPGDEGYRKWYSPWEKRSNPTLGKKKIVIPGIEAMGGLEPLLDQRREAMEGYYFPQLENQFGDAKDSLVFALSRAGLLNSTAAGEKQADLTEEYGLQRGDILSRIAGDISGTKTRMNQQRSAIEAGLRASGDQSAAANQAMQAAVTFRQDSPKLDPLGPLFYGIAESIGANQRGKQVAEIKRMSTPAPLGNGQAARVVG